MLLDNEIYVFDNFIDIEYQEDIKNILLGEFEYEGQQFPWYYIEDVTASGDPGNQRRRALAHEYVDYVEGKKVGKKLSIFHHLFLPMLKDVCRRMNIKNINVLQGRSFLQFPLNLKDRTPDTPHIDIEDKEHIVALYYVCDSDGDTIIYNERKDQGLEAKSYTIKEKITPKQGRMVIFDGTLYHTAEQPQDNIRCVVNYDLELS